jgi:hypothetical protein
MQGNLGPEAVPVKRIGYDDRRRVSKVLCGSGRGKIYLQWTTRHHRDQAHGDSSPPSGRPTPTTWLRRSVNTVFFH